MNGILLKVEDRFQIKGRGIILAPFLPLTYKLPKSAIVTLKLPDLSVLKVEADFPIPFLCFSDPQLLSQYRGEYVCLLKNIDKEAVPVGTEVWLD